MKHSVLGKIQRHYSILGLTPGCKLVYIVEDLPTPKPQVIQIRTPCFSRNCKCFPKRLLSIFLQVNDYQKKRTRGFIPCYCKVENTSTFCLEAALVFTDFLKEILCLFTVPSWDKVALVFQEHFKIKQSRSLIQSFVQKGSIKQKPKAFVGEQVYLYLKLLAL